MATRSRRTRGMSLAAGDLGGDNDFLMHMDPSLMTERQQLAFLLRKTAQENGQDASSSGDSSVSSASESSDDDATPRRAFKKPRRVAPAPKMSPKSPPPATREDLIAAALKNPAGLVLYCGRGRPPKNAIKLAPGEEMPADLKRLVETAASHLRRNPSDVEVLNSTAAMKELRVKTASDTKSDEDKTQTTNSAKPSPPQKKTSPSSTSDVSHMQVFDDHGEVWTTQCALCCHSNSPYDVPLEALFLCPTCDRKYPTQRALGLV